MLSDIHEGGFQTSVGSRVEIKVDNRRKLLQEGSIRGGVILVVFAELVL